MNKGLKKNFGRLIILALCAGVIYMLPYFKNNYYVPFKECMNLTDTQMGNLGSLYGIVATIAFLPGGILADKFSPRKIITISMLLSGLGGLWMSTYPSYPVLLFLHFLWGITANLTFWPAFIKATRMLATSDEQGKVFGLLESLRAIIGVSLMAVILFIFARMGGDSSSLRQLLLVDSGVIIAFGILGWIFLKDERGETSSQTFSLEEIKRVFKMKQTWIISLILFCTYNVHSSAYYLVPYASEVVGSTVILGAALPIIANISRMFGCSAAGALADRKGISKTVNIMYFVTLAGLALLLTARGISPVMLVPIAVIIYAGMWANYSLIYAMMEEGNFTDATAGTAIGIISFIGFFPEITTPAIAGRLLDHFDGATGYTILYTMVAVMVVIGIALTFYWMHMTREKRAELLENKKAGKTK